MKTECIGCKTIYTEKKDDPIVSAAEGAGIHRYGVTSLECIATFLDILSKEQEWFGYPPVHRLVIDAYAVQHPPHIEHQAKLNINKRFIDASVQSIAIHLIALYCIFQKKMDFAMATKVLGQVLTNMKNVNVSFEELKPPGDLGKIKAIDVQKKLESKVTIEEYSQICSDWARSAWDAWKSHHATIEKYYEKYK